MPVLDTVSIAVKKHSDQGKLIKQSIQLGL